MLNSLNPPFVPKIIEVEIKNILMNKKNYLLDVEKPCKTNYFEFKPISNYRSRALV